MRVLLRRYRVVWIEGAERTRHPSEFTFGDLAVARAQAKDVLGHRNALRKKGDPLVDFAVEPYDTEMTGDLPRVVDKGHLFHLVKGPEVE